MKPTDKQIKEFLKTNGDGDGDGDGSGYGSGYGSGNGSGNGDGNGNGNGNGSGDGDGIGDGYGDGNGIGDGYGDGIGDGYGDGDGSGDGIGDGYGDGNGDGDGYGNGIKINKFKGKLVYEIDGIPCVFLSIKRNVAKVIAISKTNFNSKEQFVVKQNNLFAHGETIKKATEDVVRKYFITLNVEEKLKEFYNKFKFNSTYSNKDFYDWHTILTGSCDSGKDMFIKNNNISLLGKMTTEKFILLTENQYNSQIIKQLKQKYNDKK